MNKAINRTTGALVNLRYGQMVRRDRGASALEYVGMVIVAAIVVGAVIAAIKEADLQSKLTDAINKILNNG